MAFVGILIMFLNLLKIRLVNKENRNNSQKQNISKNVKLLILGFIVFVLSRIFHGHIY